MRNWKGFQFVTEGREALQRITLDCLRQCMAAHERHFRERFHARTTCSFGIAGPLWYSLSRQLAGFCRLWRWLADGNHGLELQRQELGQASLAVGEGSLEVPAQK